MRTSVDSVLIAQKEEQPKTMESNETKERIRYKSTPHCDYWEVSDEYGKVVRKERFIPER